jgi:hypothetical protein
MGLVALGTSQAVAQAPPNPFCFDFDAFCDCLTVKAVADNTGGQTTRRYVGTWQNQDCAGTTSFLQGGLHDNSYLAGELNSSLGLDGTSFNFTWRSNGVFDLDLWDGTTELKVQNDSPYTIVPGVCPVDCSAAGKAPGLPPASGR